MTTSTTVIAVNAEKSASRNFYAMLTDSKGKEIPYGFEKAEDRRRWLERRGENAKAASALEVYKMLHKHSSEYIVANRNNRLSKIKAGDELNVDKGQRIVIK